MIKEVIKERRTIRHFNDKKIEEDVLIDLMDTACFAPNHRHREPWRFLVYQNEGTKQFIDILMALPLRKGSMKITPEQRKAKLEAVSCFIVVITRHMGEQKEMDEDYAACCAWIQNFQLAAWSENLGVVWKSDGYIYDPLFKEKLGIQDEEKIVGILQVGYHDEPIQAATRVSVREKMIYIKNKQ